MNHLGRLSSARSRKSWRKRSSRFADIVVSCLLCRLLSGYVRRIKDATVITAVVSKGKNENERKKKQSVIKKRELIFRDRGNAVPREISYCRCKVDVRWRKTPTERSSLNIRRKLMVEKLRNHHLSSGIRLVPEKDSFYHFPSSCAPRHDPVLANSIVRAENDNSLVRISFAAYIVPHYFRWTRGKKLRGITFSTYNNNLTSRRLDDKNL